MFIFRWLSNILAIIGIFLAILIMYFALSPLTLTSQPKLQLSDIFKDCKVENFLTNSDILNQAQSNDLKSKLGDSLPV